MRRLIAGVAALGLFGAVTAGSTPQTEAAWEVPQVATGSISAATLAAPVITGCNVRTLLNLGLAFTGVTITWTSPYGDGKTKLLINGIEISEGISKAGTGPYTYKADLSDNLLQTLLGGLLGSSNNVTVHAIYNADSNWTSAAATRTLEIGGLLGLLGENRCY